jgi:hypothetical protein
MYYVYYLLLFNFMISNNLNHGSIFDQNPILQDLSIMQRAKILGNETARLYQEALACPDEHNNTHQDRDVLSPFFKSFTDSFVNAFEKPFDAKVSMMEFIQKLYDKAQPIFASLLAA